LLELAKARGWPVIAANVPRRIATEVSRRGLAILDSLPPEERAHAAGEISCPRDGYYERFAQQMRSHGGVDTTNPAAALAAIDRFYEAQCLKDETMAESIATTLNRAGDGATVLHVNGSFHSDFGLGTAERLTRRDSTARTLLLTAVPVADPSAVAAAPHAARAHFVLFTERPPLPPVAPLRLR
jgi:uncharacterized iron-regulated protein